jgi:adenosylmethionine-8-amino-7-oxononanoate aminotransferase
MPPYCITDEELKKVYTIIVQLLEEIDDTQTTQLKGER